MRLGRLVVEGDEAFTVVLTENLWMPALEEWEDVLKDVLDKPRL